MINNYPEKRGGENYLFNVGKDLAAGKTALSYTMPDTVDPETGLAVKYYPKTLTVGFDDVNCDGNVASLQTVWWKVLIGANGKPILDTRKYWGTMNTSKTDLFYFIAGLGDAILWSMTNGVIRELLGFNDKPLFTTTPIKDTAGNVVVPMGGVIPYSEEQQNEAPTFDYNKENLVKVP